VPVMAPSLSQCPFSSRPPRGLASIVPIVDVERGGALAQPEVETTARSRIDCARRALARYR